MIRQPLRLKRAKKGQLIQVVFLIVMVVSIALTLLIAKIILSQFEEALDEGGLQTAESKDALQKWQVVFPTFDNMIVMVLVVLVIGLLITSFLIPSHPIFIAVNIFGMFFLIFLGAVLSNMYKEIIESEPLLISAATNFPKINFVMNKLPWIAVIIIFLSTIIMYSKSRGEVAYG